MSTNQILFYARHLNQTETIELGVKCKKRKPSSPPPPKKKMNKGKYINSNARYFSV